MLDQSASHVWPAGTFTADGVLGLLRESLPENSPATLPASNSPALSAMVEKLNKWQWWIAVQRGPGRKSAQARQKLADALIIADEVLPFLRAGFVQALSYAKEAGLTPLYEPYKRGIEAMDTLAKGISLASNNAPLFHIETRLPPFDRWQDFAEPLEKLFHNTVTSSNSAASQLKTAGRRFVFKVIPHLTGENPTESTVESHMKKKTPVNRGKRPL